MTELIEVEYAASNILPIAFHPGAIPTDMGSSLPEDFHHILIDTVDLAADSLVWLTEARKEWLSGRYVSANWDVTELEARKDEIVKGDKLKFKMAF